MELTEGDTMDIKNTRLTNMIWLIENKCDGDQTMFSELVNVNPAEISHIKSKKSARNMGDRLARQIELAMGLRKNWMDSAREEVIESELNQDSTSCLGAIEVWDNQTPLSVNEVEVPYYMDVELAAGNEIETGIETKGPTLRFNKGFLKRKGIQLENAACVKVSGNSMEPRLSSGDVVAIDRGRTSVNDGDTYAINHDGLLRIKRLYLIPGGGLRISSFNASEYPDETLDTEQRKLVTIIGRVFHSISDW